MFLRIQNDLEAEWADTREIEGEEMGRRNPKAQEEEEGKNPRLDDKLGKIPQETFEGKKQEKKKQTFDDDPKNTLRPGNGSLHNFYHPAYFGPYF